MIGWKSKRLAGNDRRKSFGLLPEPGEALRASRLGAEPH
jgi:hypothetical protein